MEKETFTHINENEYSDDDDFTEFYKNKWDVERQEHKKTYKEYLKVYKELLELKEKIKNK